MTICDGTADSGCDKTVLTDPSAFTSDSRIDRLTMCRASPASSARNKIKTSQMAANYKAPKGILITLLKCAVFGFAFHETANQGVWSDSSKTEALTAKYLSWTEAYFSTNNGFERTPDKLFDTARIAHSVENVWNDIIVGVNDFMTSIPEKISHAISANLDPPEKSTKR
ncbi:unnamed protein product [Nezara viridula]|uniref:MICOS complex subunit MIC13 n=1 Tax=Nezara viridula TaxID=85310 RepID=A0A9P0DYQ1_NEZVI|nr:unnamed protein product [Nezara viridula]